MELEIYLPKYTLASLSLGPLFMGLTSAGTIRLLSLKGIPRPRNVIHMCAQVHILLASPVCPAGLLIEM